MDPLAEAHVAFPRPELLETLSRGRLTWFPQDGIGWFPVCRRPGIYDNAYFDRYAAYAGTAMDRALNLARMALVTRHHHGDLVDIGIGAGSFVLARGERTFGFDINVLGIGWLKQRGLWWNPHEQPCEAVSMWDVLEHMPDFPNLLARVSRFVFVSLPVFTGPDDILTSRHFRPDEHCWYFTPRSFVRVMCALGWDCLERNDEETRLGRESIASFAFLRRP